MDDPLETALCPLHPPPPSPCLFIMHHRSSSHLQQRGNSQLPASLPLNFHDLLTCFLFSKRAFLNHGSSTSSGISVGDREREFFSGHVQGIWHVNLCFLSKVVLWHGEEGAEFCSAFILDGCGFVLPT